MSAAVEHPAGSDVAGLAVDRDAEVPIGVQLAWALRARIDDGVLSPGQRLPGLRELADALGVNVNTVRSVYQRLEQAGLIESRHGSGTFVSRALPNSAATPAGKIAAQAARQARERGVDPREVAAALYVSGAGAVNAESHDARARRRRLREQIASLERALGAIEAEYAAILPPPAPAERRRAIGPSLLSAQELESTRSELMRRLTSVQARIEQHSAADADAEAAAQAAPTARRRAQEPARPSVAEKPSRQPRRRVQPGPRPAPAT